MESNDGPSLREIGAARMREGRFAEAAEALADAVARDPQDEGAWRLLGGALASRGDAEGAISAFEQALALRPDVAKNHYNLGLQLQRIGRTGESRSRFAQALELDPTYELARARLAEMEPSIPSLPPLPPDPPMAAKPVPEPSGSMPTPPQLEPLGGAQIQRVPPPPPGYNPSRGGYAPPPQLGLGYRPAGIYEATPTVQSNTVLTLGIIGLAGGLVCGFPIVVSPIAWIMGNNALRELERYPNADPAVRSNVTAGRVLGIIGTVLLALGAALIVLAIILSIIGGN